MIVLDVRAPKGSDLDTLATLRTVNPQVKVLLITGYARSDIPYPLTDSNLAFLRKPFDVDKLLQVIEELIRQ